MRYDSFADRGTDIRYIKKRIRKTQVRTQWVGIFYLLAIISLSVLAFMPTLKIPYLNVIPGLTDNKMVWQDLRLGLNIDTLSRLLYVTMLVTAIVNVFRGFAQLKWLYKKKASSEYGYNRNLYAMNKLSNIFSGAFAMRLIGNMVLLLLNGTYQASQGKLDTAVIMDSLMSIKDLKFGMDVAFPVAGIFVLIGMYVRILCGFFGAKASFFVEREIEDRYGRPTGRFEQIEKKREVGRLVPFYRNSMQLGMILSLGLYLLSENKIYPFLMDFAAGKVNFADIGLYLYALVFIFWVVLVFYATGDTEYNPQGIEGSGMKVFKCFISLTLLVLLLTLMWNCMGGKLDFANFKFDVANPSVKNTNAIIVATVYTCIWEFFMRKFPRNRNKERYNDEYDDGGYYYEYDE